LTEACGGKSVRRALDSNDFHYYYVHLVYVALCRCVSLASAAALLALTGVDVRASAPVFVELFAELITNPVF
jgi:hypothetical protein